MLLTYYPRFISFLSGCDKTTHGEGDLGDGMLHTRSITSPSSPVFGGTKCQDTSKGQQSRDADYSYTQRSVFEAHGGWAKTRTV